MEKIKNMFKKLFRNIKYSITSKRTLGATIIAFLLTGYSYFIATPLFHGAGTIAMFRIDVFTKHGFPWNFSVNSPATGGLSYFNLLYFILDLIFWYIVFKLLILGINLASESQKKKTPTAILIVLIVFGFLSVNFYQMNYQTMRKTNDLRMQNAELENTIEEYSSALEQANSNIEEANDRVEKVDSIINNAKVYAWESYQEMGDALDSLQKVNNNGISITGYHRAFIETVSEPVTP